MDDCFNQLEDSSNYPAGVLQTNVKNTSYIAGRGIKSQMLYVSRQSSLLYMLWQSCIPCFLSVPPCIGLRLCPNAVMACVYSVISLSLYVNRNKSIQVYIN